MDANDIKFEIADLLLRNWNLLIEKAESTHGKCPRGLKIALSVAFWNLYSPNKHVGLFSNLEILRVTGNRVCYVDSTWRIQETYISKFNFRTVSMYLDKKKYITYKKWLKKQND